MRRKLRPELHKFLNEKLGFQGGAVDCFISAATACVGILEESENRGEYIDMFHEAAHSYKGAPWCMSFVQAMVAFIENRCKESALPVGAGCVDVFSRAPESMKVVDPRRGDIIVWKHIDSMAGHCGIITRVGAEFYATIEGNTSGGKGIDRNGDGVYARQRSKKPAGTLQILGFLRPFPDKISCQTPLQNA